MHPSTKQQATPGSSRSDDRRAANIAKTIIGSSAVSSRKPWFSTASATTSDFTSGSGRKLGDPLTGRTIRTVTAVSADGTQTPKNGPKTSTHPIATPINLADLFSASYSQESLAYGTQENEETSTSNPNDNNDIDIDTNEGNETKESNPSKSSTGGEDDYDAVPNEDDDDDSTVSGTDHTRTNENCGETASTSPSMNKQVSKRNTKDTRKDDTSAQHNQSIDLTSSQSVTEEASESIKRSESIKTATASESTKTTTTKTTVAKTTTVDESPHHNEDSDKYSGQKDKQDEVDKDVTLPPIGIPKPPPGGFDYDNAEDSEDNYIPGTTIRKIKSIATWDLDTVPTDYNVFWEEPPCVLIEALKHYCLEGKVFETPRGWTVMYWKLKQGYPFEGDTKLKRMPGLEALERLETLVLKFPEHGTLKEGTKIKYPPAWVKASERAAENQKTVSDAAVKMASWKRLLKVRTDDKEIKNLNDAITKYEKISAIAIDKHRFFTLEANTIKTANVQRLKLLKTTAVTSRQLADQQKADDELCRSLEIEMASDALGTTNEGQKDDDSISRAEISATTNPSQYNASTTATPTDTPAKKPVRITGFARTYRPATDMTYVNEMTLFAEEPSNFNEDIHIVDEFISRVVLGSLVKLNRDTKEACKLGANKLHLAELEVWNTKNILTLYSKPGMFMKSIQLKAQITLIEPLRHDNICIGLVEEMKKNRMEYQQRMQDTLNRYSKQKYTYFKSKLLDTFHDVMINILQLRARWTAPVMDKRILAKMMDFDEDEFTNEDPNDTKSDKFMNMNDASGFAYLLLLTGKAATALKAWGKFQSTDHMLERLTRRLRYPIRQQIDETKDFPFECIQFGAIAYKKPNPPTWKLAKVMAEELEKYTVEVTLQMKISFHMQVTRSKCKKGVEVYQNRGEAVARTADVSDIVKRSPEGSNDATIEFNKWRRNLYLKCSNKLRESSAEILRTSSTLQQQESDNALTNQKNRINHKNNTDSNRKNRYTKPNTPTTATVTGGTPRKHVNNPYNKKKKSRDENSADHITIDNSKDNTNNVDDETLTQSTAGTSKRSPASQNAKRKRNQRRRSDRRQNKTAKT